MIKVSIGRRFYRLHITMLLKIGDFKAVILSSHSYHELQFHNIFIWILIQDLARVKILLFLCASLDSLGQEIRFDTFHIGILGAKNSILCAKN